MYFPLKITLNKTNMKSLTILLWLNISFFLATVRFVLARFGIVDGPIRSILLFSITLIPFIFLLAGVKGDKNFISQNITPFFYLYASIVIIFLISLFSNPQLSVFYFRNDYGIGPVFCFDGAIYAFLIFSICSDPLHLINILIKTAYIKFFYLIVVVFIPAMIRGYWIDIAPGGGTMEFSYSLSFGYDMLFPLTVCLVAWFDNHKIVHLIIAFSSAILIVTNGGRGAILCLVLFMVLLFINRIIEKRVSMTKIILLIIIMFFLGAFLFILKDYFLSLIVNVLSISKISSRSLEMIVNGTFSDSNGREQIWNTVVDAIRTGGPFGYGLFGDRPFVSPLHVAGYSHNLFLELLVSFGIIGVVCIIYILIDAIRMIFFCKDKNWRLIYIVLFICSCKLFLSLSLWYVWEFWAAAAVAYKYKVLVKKNLNEIQKNTD